MKADTVLSLKYHAIMYNTHVWFAARKFEKKFVIDREYGATTLQEHH